MAKEVISRSRKLDPKTPFTPTGTWYEPCSVSIVGRVWSTPYRTEWTDKNGKVWPRTMIKVYVGDTSIYKCVFLFEQANTAYHLAKKDIIGVCGLDYIFETAKTGKRWHTLHAQKLIIFPQDFDALRMDQLFLKVDGMLDRMDEIEERIARLEAMNNVVHPMEDAPKGDNDRLLRKKDSLSAVVGDIYGDIDASAWGRY